MVKPMWWHIHQRASQRTMRHGNRVKTGCKTHSQSWYDQWVQCFFLGQNLRFGVEVSWDGFVSSTLITAQCIRRRSLSRGARHLGLDFSWGDIQETNICPQPSSKIHTSPKLAAILFFRRLTSRSWKWPMLGIYMTKLMEIPCELKRPWRHLAWMISDSPPFFWEGGRTSRNHQKKLGRVWVCFFWFCFPAFLRDAVIFGWPTDVGARKDHLVALAIAKKRRDDLKRKADEVMASFWFVQRFVGIWRLHWRSMVGIWF